MCSSYRSNQNPQTVKLSPRSSLALLGRYENVLTPMRPNRPHISSYNYSFKEHRHKTNNTPELRAHMPSYIQLFRGVSHRPAEPSVCVSASAPFRCRLSRPGRSDPQVKKTHCLTFFCHAQRLWRFFTLGAGNLHSLSTGAGGESQKSGDSFTRLTRIPRPCG